jgi:hypothetical protein
MRLIATLWQLLRDLVRDLSSGVSANQTDTDDEQAQVDDVLDAELDEDGMDATGL